MEETWILAKSSENYDQQLVLTFNDASKKK